MRDKVLRAILHWACQLIMEMWRPATSFLELQMKDSFKFDMSTCRFFHQLEEAPWRQYQLGSAGCDFTTYGLRSDETTRRPPIFDSKTNVTNLFLVFHVYLTSKLFWNHRWTASFAPVAGLPHGCFRRLGKGFCAGPHCAAWCGARQPCGGRTAFVGSEVLFGEVLFERVWWGNFKVTTWQFDGRCLVRE